MLTLSGRSHCAVKDVENRIKNIAPGPKTAQKWRPYWIFELSGSIKSETSKISQIPSYRICRYSPKKGINQASELLDGSLSQDGTFISSFRVSRF